jgi:2-polyprenyl-3-methyl-5-hydroxy-6-metoxy-1,4-benzoquinol methylase
MATIRTNGELDVTFFKNEQVKHQFGNDNEWVDEQTNLNLGEVECRIDIPSWQDRYEYESNILSGIINENKFNKIIELGSGPGALGQKIMEKSENLDYTFIDQPGAKKIFEDRNHKGTFFVKDLMNSFDTEGLSNNYDFLITNDFLEHIYNPSMVVQECYKLIKDGGKMFVSVPNWRMGHTFIYRGLFDYDNFVYFMYTHGFEISKLWDSPLKCQYSPKETSESQMDNKLINSWNWYMLFNKRN